MSAPILTETQTNDLQRAIVSYLANKPSFDPALIRQLCSELSIESNAYQQEDPRTLERKWIALVRLQRKLLDLEQQNSSLKLELKEARENAVPASASQPANSIDNWLPRWPPRHTLEGHRGRITCVAFHPKWTIVASGSEDGSIKIWDYERGELEQTIKAHTRSVLSLAFASQSKVLVSCSADLSIRVWDPSRKFANTLTLVGHDHTISCVTVVVDPRTDKEYVISGSRDKTIRVWELATGFAVRVIRTHSDWVRSLDTVVVIADGAGSSNDVLLLSAGSDRTLRLTSLFDKVSDESSLIFEGHTNVIECCAFAPSSALKYIAKHHQCQPSEKIFASGGRDSTIYIWASRHTEGPILKLVGHDNWVQGVAFHPSGRFLVSVGDDRTMRIWDLATAKLRKTIPAHEHFVSTIAWHGKTIATGSVDQTVRIW